MAASVPLDPHVDDAAVHALLAITGGTLHVGPYGPEIDLGARGALIVPALAALPEYGVLRVTGADAVKFLHAQLTNDLEHLSRDEAQWTGYCTAKGRLLATALAWRDDEGVWLLVSRPLAASLRKRLAMFVLRAKASVTDVSDAHAVLGVMRASDAATPPMPAWPAPMRVARDGEAFVLGLPAIPATVEASTAAVARALMIVPAAALAAIWSRLASAYTPVASSVWRLGEVRAAVPRIVPGTWEAFVPQMVNLELVGGVSFKKGCYPGQEVVARSQYLGKLKRRMHAGRVAGEREPQPGDDVARAGGGEAAGTVVLAAPSGDAYEVLFEAQTAALADGAITIAGAPVQRTELPYPLP